MSRRRPLTPEESVDARHALQEKAAQGRLPWAEGVRIIRRALGMTQAEYAKAFHLTLRQVSQLETGAANPTVDTLLRIAAPLGLSVGLIPSLKD